MRRLKFGSLFSGGGGADVGAKVAGYDLAWGVELRPDIAEVANANLGQHVIAANILDLDPAGFDPVDLLHASPPCPSFSTAKTGGEETDLDIALAQKTADFVAALRPRVFTLENVYAYRSSKSWAIIAETLARHGYRFNYWYVNSADYGVPQTRKRMIVVARLDGRTPSLPPATHAENPVPGLFGTLDKWVGWHAAIEDLIPTLPDSQFAPWQLGRLPEEMRTMLVDSAGYPDADGRTPVMRDEGDPANVVVSNHERRPMRAALVGINANDTSGAEIFIGEDQPAQTIRTASGGRVMRAAFIVDGKLSKSGDERALQIHPEDEPVGTIVSAHSAMRDGRAFVVDGQNVGREITILDGEKGFYSVTASNKGTHRAHVAGRVAKMTPRALARFQSFPDWYSLPAHKTLRELTGAALVPVAEETEKNVDGRLATTIIGNAVPPLLYQRLAEYIAETAL